MANKKFWTKKNIIIVSVVAAVLIAGIVTAAVLLSRRSNSVKTAEATVARGSLSASINASGTVIEAGISGSIPFYACLNDITDLDSINELENDFNWSDILFNTHTPVVYKVVWVNEKLLNRKITYNTKSEPTDVFSAEPYYIDYEAVERDRKEAIEDGRIPGDTTVTDFLLKAILGKKDSLSDLPTEYIKPSTNADERVTVSTQYAIDIINAKVIPEETGVVEFSFSNFKLSEGQNLMLDTAVFKIAVTQLYTSFTVTEYDVVSIVKRLNSGEKMYAGVTINALNGQKVVADIQEVIKGSYSAGVAYYAVRAKVIFGTKAVLDLTDENNLDSSAAQRAVKKGLTELEYSDYTYYDPDLTPAVVESLGLDITEWVERDEVLVNYSVSVSVQKEAVIDKLIVPTKCIYYDDAKKPYVIVTGEKKDYRVYVKILLSTGSEASVEVKEGTDNAQGVTLEEGDKILYQADSSLISSILG